MAESRLLIPLLLLIQLLVSAATLSSAWPFPPIPQTTNNQSTEASLSSQQFTNIIEALVGAGDFSDWASALSVPDPSTFPITATLFVPTNPNNLFTDPTLLAYHTVPQHLTFSNLVELPTHSLLPTLLPNKSIQITSNSSLNFTIESRRITRPDVVVSGPLVVHGIDSVLPLEGFGIGDGLYESESCCSVGGIGSPVVSGATHDWLGFFWILIVCGESAYVLLVLFVVVRFFIWSFILYCERLMWFLFIKLCDCCGRETWVRSILVRQRRPF